MMLKYRETHGIVRPPASCWFVSFVSFRVSWCFRIAFCALNGGMSARANLEVWTSSSFEA